MSKLGYEIALEPEHPTLPPLLLTPVKGYDAISRYLKSIVLELKSNLVEEYCDIHYSLQVNQDKDVIMLTFYGVKRVMFGLWYKHYTLANVNINDFHSNINISNYGHAYTWDRVVKFTPSFLHKYECFNQPRTNSPCYFFRTPFWRKYD